MYIYILYVCIYVCMYVCMYVCTYIHKCRERESERERDIDVYMYIPIFIHTWTQPLTGSEAVHITALWRAAAATLPILTSPLLEAFASSPVPPPPPPLFSTGTVEMQLSSRQGAPAA